MPTLDILTRSIPTDTPEQRGGRAVAHAHIDASDGVTGEMLLGALVDAGASIERVDAAVRTLGIGTPRIAWARVRRGDEAACLVRVHAPELTPEVDRWVRMRDVLTYAALPDAVRERALETLRRMVTAEAGAAGHALADVVLPSIGVLDAMANVVGVCAAVDELGLETMGVGPVGVGTGAADTVLGPRPVPLPAVRRLLEEHGTVRRPVAAELTTATGAALVATLARPGVSEPPATTSRIGRGAGARHGAHAAVLRLHLA